MPIHLIFKSCISYKLITIRLFRFYVFEGLVSYFSFQRDCNVEDLSSRTIIRRGSTRKFESCVRLSTMARCQNPGLSFHTKPKQTLSSIPSLYIYFFNHAYCLGSAQRCRLFRPDRFIGSLLHGRHFKNRPCLETSAK